MRHLAISLVLVGCGDDATFPTRVIDCPAIETAYATSCTDHLGIDIDTTACALVDERQNSGLGKSIDRAAAVCESALTAVDTCDRIFVCVADSEGFSALTTSVTATGTADVEGDRFVFDATPGWAWVGTKLSGNAGDFAALITLDGQPWYFKLEDFYERHRTNPFVVDAARPIKLENGQDNVELTAGTVTVTTFTLGGAFDISASGEDAAGDAIELRIQGTFAE